MTRLALAAIACLAAPVAGADALGSALASCWAQQDDATRIAQELSTLGWDRGGDTTLVADAVAMTAPFQSDLPYEAVLTNATRYYTEGLPLAAERARAGEVLTSAAGDTLLVEHDGFAVACTLVFAPGTDAGTVARALPAARVTERDAFMTFSAHSPDDNPGAIGTLWQPNLSAYAAVRPSRPAGAALILTTTALQR